MKILVLVLSSKKPPYDKLQEAQLKTWDSINVDGVETIYYYGEDYNMMHYAFKECLDQIINTDFDFIFRTNSSSYVNKELLMKEALTLPKINLYMGVQGSNTMCSGSGFFMSKDVLLKIYPLLTSEPYPSEDCLIGIYCETNGIYPTKGAKRFDYWFNAKHGDMKIVNDFPVSYLYRCKSNDEDRNKDIEAFNFIHNFFANNKISL